MIDAIGSGLEQILQWETLLLMVLGIFIGFIVGILPGLGGAVTIALLLPFTFAMEPVQGIVFLLSMWIVTGTAGDITSVLFGIPGEATSAAAVLDGYPMTKKGQAGRALGIVLTSSTIGIVFGAIVLGVFITVIRPLVLLLGPPEFFMLVLLGLAFVVTLSGKSPAKGMAMVALGLLASYVGSDPSAGLPRFTFDQMYLWGGIELIPVVVGLFGGAEVLQLMLTRSSIATGSLGDAKLSGTMRGVGDALRHWFLAVRSSAIGVIIGMLPGLGGTVAQWVSYGQARQTSKNPEQFGEGAIDGLVAAGATNNAKDAGSLIPTIAFGIPGGAATAVLLGGFMVLGITPGQAMLTTQLDVTFSMVWTVIIAGILGVALALALVRPLASLTRISGTVLTPILFLFLVIGAYTASNNWGDLFVMLAASVLGVVCLRWDWPRVPFLLALVLGALLEQYLNLSNTLFSDGWLTRPGVIIIGVIVLATFVLSVRSVARDHKRRAADQPVEGPRTQVIRTLGRKK
ncbi:MAG: tripartite tricarboxylate transporter permease [Microbacterium sp.]|uniref:tripartite tricarboxylate transporter permease n=1 Tax=Microbacterium sp. TaxID=51671 RepID=UPI00271A9A80|nr:tripartite tricarboxylate transporter permease [Microbacterium sp.]MDO8384664.1 tripartite tricarboxylate transporter permease [Microbacterium sp.]